ncbi:MAG: hypothetical protein H0T75_23235, partial [Rhizobiales bacterium]|nr:hypothetical protein [Hyphomicrobiales bacterium]
MVEQRRFGIFQVSVARLTGADEKSSWPRRDRTSDADVQWGACLMPASLHKAEKATHAEKLNPRNLATARSVQFGKSMFSELDDSSSLGPKVVIYHAEVYDLQAPINIEKGVPSILAGDASVIAKIGERSPDYICLNEWRDDEDFAQSLRRVYARPELKAVLAAEEARELFSGAEDTSRLELRKHSGRQGLHAAAGPLEAEDGMAAFLQKLGTEQDGLCRAIRWAIRLGFTDIGLLDLRRHGAPRGFGRLPDDDPPDELASADRLNALQALRNDLLSVRGTFLISILDAGSELSKRGVFPYRSAAEFLHARRLEAVLCPLTPREVSRAVANLKLWTGPEFAPYLSIPDTPSVDLVYVFNCSEDASLREQLESAFRDCQPLPQMFRQLKVEFLNLAGEDDLYIRVPNGPAPRYGYKAGPNLLFFGSLLKLRGYKGFAFLMETDCTPVQPGWVQLLDRTCKQKSDAWLIGSLYRGAGILGNNIRRHLNGNALYAVGNEDFWNFLDPSYLLWLESKVKHSDPNLAFDCAW